MSNILQFVLGLQDDGFNATLNRSLASMDAVRNKTAAMTSELGNAKSEMTGAGCDPAEILGGLLERMGGSFASLGKLAGLALDPATLPFAALFAAMDLWSDHIKAVAGEWADFQKQAVKGEDIVKGIIAARPTADAQWMKQLENAAKTSENPVDINSFADNSNDTAKAMDKNSADAAGAELDNEVKKIELLKQQGQISEENAAKQIAALKNQYIWQKNLADQKAITDEISRGRADLANMQSIAAKAPSETDALNQKQAADAKVDDLKRILTDLPKAIEENKKTIAIAKSHATSGISYDPQWMEQADSANERGRQLKAQLDSAHNQLPGAIQKAAEADVNVTNARNLKASIKGRQTKITGLETQQAVTVDRQRKLTPKEIEANDLVAKEATATKTKKENGGSKPEYTSFEKMGFVMGGASNPLLDATKRQTTATQQLTNALTGLATRLTASSPTATTSNQL